MSDILSTIVDTNRILIEADLQPVQGARFQPTGFPSLGAATFQGPRGGEMLLVESPQSMANRLEATIWDDEKDDIAAVFEGLPYVSTTVNGRTTDSLREAHRLNSPYLISDPEFKAQLTELAGIAGKKAKGKKASDDEEADESSGVDVRRLARAVFHFDPNSVLHGVFLEKIIGLARLTRVLSAFIEASGVRPVESGGVKNDRIDPKGGQGGAAQGFGNVPFARTEYTAEKIIAYFSVDLGLLRSYGLGSDAERLLTATALWKIQRFLEAGGRLRTACDLELIGTPRVVRPGGAALPNVTELESAIKQSIGACRASKLFSDPPKTVVVFEVKAK